MDAERSSQEERRRQLEAITDKEDKLEELQKDVAKWKEKYRRRVKSFTGTTRGVSVESTLLYLETLDNQYDDLEQANEFLMETYTVLISLKNELTQDVADLTKEKSSKAQDLLYQTKVYQDTRQETMAAMRNARREAQQPASRETQQASAGYHRSGGINRSSGSVNSMIGRLKKVDLPKFHSELRDYFRWKSTFEVLVEKNGELDGNAKFMYLEQSLTGEAHKIMEHLDHSEESYKIALDMLEKKYGGKERQIQHLYNTVKDIKPVKDFHSLQEFQYTLLGVQSMLTTFDMRQEGIILHMQLCEKLHHRYMKDYLNFLARNEEEKNLTSLIAYVTKELETSQAAYEATSGRMKADGAKTSFEDTRIKKRNINSVNKSKGERKCADCDENHPVWRCDKFQKRSINDRLKIVKNRSLCFVCLGKGHSKAECYFKGKCVDGCLGGHHRLLHQERESSTNKAGISEDRRSSGSTNQVKKKPVHSTEIKKTSVDEENDEIRPVDMYALSCAPRESTRTALNLIPVYVFKNNGTKKIRCLALHDSGSNTTLISDRLKRQLGLHGRKETHLYNQPMMNEKVKREVEVIDTVKIESLDGEFSLKMKNVETMPGQLQAEAVDWCQYKDQFEYLKNVTFPDVNPQEKADLLIGADQTILFQHLDQRPPAKNGDPIAIKTPLGWICMGIIPCYRTVKQIHFLVSEERHLYHNYRQDEEEVGAILRRFWEVDQFQHSEVETSVENVEVLKQTRARTRYTGGRYEVGMPFNDRKIDEPSQEFKEDMWKMATKRLESTERALQRKEGIKEKYQEVLDGYLEKGYAKIAPDPENTRWLLPHFAVIREDKETSKVRIVFDGAAKVQDISLNDQMHEGPKLQQDIFNVLLRFRRYQIAINSDIKEMFPGVAVLPEERKYLRILWRSFEQRRPDVIELQRVTFGVNASPFLAILTLQDHARRYQSRYPRAVEALITSTYVDDTLDSVETVQEAEKIRQQMIEICRDAGWKIHKWSSNSEEFLKPIPAEDRAQGSPLAQGDSDREGTSIKTLGLRWIPQSDEFVGEATSIDLNGKKITKRIVLQKIAKIFDPLGMMAPYVMQCKMILQEVWMSGIDWDDQLDDELRKRTLAWFKELQFADCIRQPRVLLPNLEKITQAELHCFADASQKAYGAVIYLKLMYDQETAIKWVTAKAKVCPVEPVSIPRLELMAAVLGAQMTEKVRDSLAINGVLIRMWTDSMTVLWWIVGRERNLKLFVANRVMEIHKCTDPSQWRHVSGEQNPADILSRGCSLQELRDSILWKTGPEFIKKDAKQWPSQVKCRTKEADREVKKQYLNRCINYFTSSVKQICSREAESEADGSDEKADSEDSFSEDSSSEDSSSEDDSEDEVLTQARRSDHMVNYMAPSNEYDVNSLQKEGKSDISVPVKLLKVDPEVDYLSPERYSSINRLTRVRAFVKRFVHNATFSKEKTTGCLQVWELREAEKEIVVNEQKRRFPSEYTVLLKGKAIDATSKLRELNPKLDQDGVMRVGGRIRDHPNMTFEMQCPTILPKQSHVTDLLIKREHQENHMMGTNYLLGKLKEKYWLLSGRRQIKSVVGRCMKCKLLKYKAMTQQMGLVPASRTQMSLRAFVNTGVDLAGPVVIKIGRGKQRQKRWICLFTCLATRAVHLELCYSLETDSFMNALARFVSRRGLPKTMTSDNGTNFRGADNEMRRLFEMFESKTFQERSCQMRIQWRFNPPGGPHRGGVFEAMIKAAKTALRDVLQKDLTEEELTTALISAEGMINQRPLSYISADETFILTPNHFLHGSLGGLIAPEVLDGTPTFQKRWRMVQDLLKTIWDKWLREWVTELNRRKKWFGPEENLKVGDIVMLIEDGISKTRGNFPLARVTEVYTGPDGLVRTCKVKTANGQVATKIIQKLAKIESSVH